MAPAGVTRRIQSLPHIRYLVLVLILAISALIAYVLVYNIFILSENEKEIRRRETAAIARVFTGILNASRNSRRHMAGLSEQIQGHQPSQVQLCPEQLAIVLLRNLEQDHEHQVRVLRRLPDHPSFSPDEQRMVDILEHNPGWTECSAPSSSGDHYYYILRLPPNSTCNSCHNPTSQTKLHSISGEGFLSIRVPLRIMSATTRQTLLGLSLATFLLVGIAVFFVFRLLRKVSRLSRQLVESNLDLEERNLLLQHLEQGKSEMYQMLIHDMKAPLTFMTGSLQLLQERKVGRLTERQVELVSLVLRGCYRLRTIISNILDINRLEEGKLELHFEPVDLPRFFEEKGSTWKGFAESQDKCFDVQILPGAEEVITDAALLERILENLVSNALKHTRPGEGSIVISVSPPETEDGFTFCVSDNGEGIPDEFHAVLFEKFTTAQRQKMKMSSDTGLGMPFCKMAVESMGGRIWFRSAPGAGTDFCFLLPTIPVALTGPLKGRP